MGIALRHDRALVPEQSLDLVQIHALVHEASGKGVSQIVKRQVLDAGLFQGRIEAPHEVPAIEPGPAGRCEDRQSA
jgi:hypothetical protein